MGRRKLLFRGGELSSEYQVALGFPDYQREIDIFDELEVELPKIDWDSIERRLDCEIHQYSKDEVDLCFKAVFNSRLHSAITEAFVGKLPCIELTEADFMKKSDRIERLAVKLTEEINELVEMGSALAIVPKSLDGLTSGEKPDEFYSKVTGKVVEPSDDCFFDYITFRKYLDYLSNFSQRNGNFDSILGRRFDRGEDYSWYETFVRRVVLYFWPTDFPMTVTIPTDSNPSYHSPIIVVLEEIRRQINLIAKASPGFSDLYEEWTYRQHARLVTKLRDEFTESDVFWTLNSLRRYEAEQSAF